jgi:succinoglycan biosynthesis protein ExoM
VREINLISICLCTYKRPSVVKTIESILKQTLPAGKKLEIIVVDNDSDKTGEELINSFFSENSLVHCYSYPVQNIAGARNLSVEKARGEWVIFIDDDEQAGNNWLTELFGMQIDSSADVVAGSVVGVIPNGAPDWLFKSDLYNKVLGKKGAVIKHCFTSNTLVRRSILEDLKFMFDERYGLTGGSDTELFSRLREAGCVMVSNPDAIVYEDVEPDRIELKYLIRRSLRSGETYERIFIKGGFAKSILTTALCLIKIVMFFIGFVSNIPLGLNRSIPFLLNIVSCWGRLRVLLGVKSIEIYSDDSV